MEKNSRAFILEILSFQDYDREKLKEYLEGIEDFAALVEFVKRNKIAGIVYTVLKKEKLLAKLPVEEKNRLMELYSKNVVLDLDYMTVLSDISKVMKNAGYKHAFIKGAYLIPKMYEIGQRTSNDVDILISQNDINGLDVDMKNGEFFQKISRDGELCIPSRKEKIFARMNYGELIPYFKDYKLYLSDNFMIDVNISLDFQAKENVNVVDKLLQNTMQYKVNGNDTLYTLEKAEFFIYLCAHLFKEATTMDWVKQLRDTDLYKYIDIYLFIKMFGTPDFLSTLKEKVMYYGTQKECYYTMKTSTELFSIFRENQAILDFMEAIQPEDTKYMNEIYSPLDKKTFQYHMNFVDWIFCNEKLSLLKEE